MPTRLLIIPWWLAINVVSTWLYVFCVWIGVSIFLGGPRTASIDAQIPGWTLYWWAALLVLGGIVATTGSFWRKPHLGLLMEGAGDIFLIFGIGAYVAAAIATLGVTSLPAPVQGTSAFLAVFAARALQCRALAKRTP